MPADLLEHALAAKGFMPEDEGLLLYSWDDLQDQCLPFRACIVGLLGACPPGVASVKVF